MNGIPSSSLFYAALMLMAGVGIPIMAALNAGLGTRLQSPAYAAVILLFVGLTAALAYMLIFQGLPQSLASANT
ncbi:MAG: DMT family transporter, partial [Gammaproteobacteria bacterium]